MKKAIVLFTIMLMLIGCGHKPKAISDNYATSALLALKDIEGDLYVPEKDGVVNRYTQEKINVAEVAAVSPEERANAAALGAVYEERLFVNMSKAHVGEPSFIKEDAVTQEGFLAKCFSDFDDSLRARSSTVPPSCAVFPQMRQRLEAEEQQWIKQQNDQWQEKQAQEAQKRKQAADRAYQQEHLDAIHQCDDVDQQINSGKENIWLGSSWGWTRTGATPVIKKFQKLCEDVRNGKRHALVD
jgi:carbonic anhydrase/acetyltransferase-like protein (isoleucine patch superfamily)